MKYRTIPPYRRLPQRSVCMHQSPSPHLLDEAVASFTASPPATASLHMAPNRVPKGRRLLHWTLSCTPLAVQVLGAHSCGGATGKASKLRNMGFILSVLGSQSVAPRCACCLFPEGSMVDISSMTPCTQHGGQSRLKIFDRRTGCNGSFPWNHGKTQDSSDSNYLAMIRSARNQRTRKN